MRRTSLLILSIAALPVSASMALEAARDPSPSGASCAVTCDDGTSCRIARADDEPSAIRLDRRRQEALEAIRRDRERLTRAIPEIGPSIARLELAAIGEDRAAIDAALLAIAAAAERAGLAIPLSAGLTCACRGDHGRQAICDT